MVVLGQPVHEREVSVQFDGYQRFGVVRKNRFETRSISERSLAGGAVADVLDHGGGERNVELPSSKGSESPEV